MAVDTCFSSERCSLFGAGWAEHDVCVCVCVWAYWKRLLKRERKMAVSRTQLTMMKVGRCTHHRAQRLSTSQAAAVCMTITVSRLCRRSPPSGVAVFFCRAMSLLSIFWVMVLHCAGTDSGTHRSTKQLKLVDAFYRSMASVAPGHMTSSGIFFRAIAWCFVQERLFTFTVCDWDWDDDLSEAHVLRSCSAICLK